MRKVLVVFAILAAVAAGPAVALASSSGGTSPINCQTSKWTTTSQSTSSSTFSALGALETDAPSIYPVAISVNAVVSGRPVEFRLTDTSVAGIRVVPPGKVPFAPTGTNASPFSFTWTDPGSAAAVHGHDINVSFRRSSAGGSSTVVRADVVITYKTDMCDGSN